VTAEYCQNVSQSGGRALFVGISLLRTDAQLLQLGVISLVCGMCSLVRVFDSSDAWPTLTCELVTLLPLKRHLN
jgi:hypothetical protein